MALNGLAKVCLLLACSAGPPDSLTVPLRVIGVGGSTTGRPRGRARLTVPELGTLVLLGSGIVGLVGIGRSRRVSA